MSAALMIIHKGGFMMYPLLIASVVLIAIILERAVSLRRAIYDGDDLLDQVKTIYKEGSKEQVEASVALCQKLNRPVTRMFARGLKNAGRSEDAIEMAMEQEASNELPALESNLSVMKTIVNIAPLLGLLGTIAGMISSFEVASAKGLSNPTAILGGISEALYSTATGITLAVIGFIFFNYYATLSRKIIDDMEFYGAELVNFLTGRVE